MDDERHELGRTKVALTHAGTLKACDDTRSRLHAVEIARTSAASALTERTKEATDCAAAWSDARDTASQHQEACKAFEPTWLKAAELDQQIVHVSKHAAEAGESALRTAALSKDSAERLATLVTSKARWTEKMGQANDSIVACSDAGGLLDSLGEGRLLSDRYREGRDASQRTEEDLGHVRQLFAHSDSEVSARQRACRDFDEDVERLINQIKPLSDKLEFGEQLGLREELAQVSALRIADRTGRTRRQKFGEARAENTNMDLLATEHPSVYQELQKERTLRSSKRERVKVQFLGKSVYVDKREQSGKRRTYKVTPPSKKKK